MKVFGRITVTDGTSRQVQATAANCRSAEMLIHQKVDAGEVLIFVWAATLKPSDERGAWPDDVPVVVAQCGP